MIMANHRDKEVAEYIFMLGLHDSEILKHVSAKAWLIVNMENIDLAMQA